jgi:hypothetical protein
MYQRQGAQAPVVLLSADDKLTSACLMQQGACAMGAGNQSRINSDRGTNENPSK